VVSVVLRLILRAMGSPENKDQTVAADYELPRQA
jgi:hypothetical protein